jgi:hypothetical protein
MMYGGIDSVTKTVRLNDLNGVMANIAARMANETACLATAADFAKPQGDRLLFPHVDIGAVPGEGDFEIRDNLVYLHERLLGEVLPYDHAEIERSYQLFIDVREDGLSGIQAGEYPATMIAPCQAVNDPLTGEPFELPILDDPDYTIRAWMAVTTAMLGDFEFMFE